MKSFIVFVALSLSLSACNSGGNQHPTVKYEEKKTSLREMEKDSPLKFLKATASHHTNLIYQAVVMGEITNIATLASYKDIVLQISWLDKGGAVIEKQKQTLDNVVKPNSTADFKIKTSHVKGMQSVSVNIISAVADN